MGKILGMIGQGVSNLLTGILNNRLQQDQNEKLLEQQGRYNREQTDYNMQKQLEFWQKTGYSPQVEQMKAAGLNPAMLYGGGGQGGSTNVATSSSGGASAGANSLAPMDVAGLMQLELLKAQKENIEADTAKKKAEEQNIGVDTEGKGMENAFQSYMRSTSPDGVEGVTIGESVRGKQEVENYKRQKAETQFKLDENEREALMNSKVMERIGAEITKMAAEGKNLEEIYQNLVKQGKLLDAEIEWRS